MEWFKLSFSAENDELWEAIGWSNRPELIQLGSGGNVCYI